RVRRAGRPRAFGAIAARDAPAGSAGVGCGGNPGTAPRLVEAGRRLAGVTARGGAGRGRRRGARDQRCGRRPAGRGPVHLLPVLTWSPNATTATSRCRPGGCWA